MFQSSRPSFRGRIGATPKEVRYGFPRKVQDLEVVDVIPDELWSLTSLTNLNLERNCLTGPFSAAIANLTGLQYFTIGINDLSGEIPKELAQLTELRSLAFGRNSNFSGSLPSERGNLFKLQQLFIHSYTKDWKFKLQVFLSYNKGLFFYFSSHCIYKLFLSSYGLFRRLQSCSFLLLLYMEKFRPYVPFSLLFVLFLSIILMRIFFCLPPVFSL